MSKENTTAYTRKDCWQALSGIALFVVVSFVCVGLPEWFDKYCWEPPLWLVFVLVGAGGVVCYVLEERGNWRKNNERVS